MRCRPGPAKIAVASTAATVRSARRELAALRPGAANRKFAVAARAAMTHELAWLNAAAAVLANPTSQLRSQLAALDADARSTLQAIDKQIPGASESFPSSASLITYAQAKTAASQARRALMRFTDQIQSLLAQSRPAYLQINHLFQQMQIAASGGTPTITLAEAESILTTVIANRTSLAASARALSAPTPLAASVRDALVAAMDASLANDHDISVCLHEANTGDVAIIFQNCLDSTAPSSRAATSAKQHFLAVYNQLRSRLGLPATMPQF